MVNKIDLNLLSTVGASDGQALVYSAALGAVQYGAASGGGTDWQTSIVTSNTLSAVAGKGYWIDTSSNTCTVTLPSSASVGDTIEFSDYKRTWGANAVTIDANGLNFQGRTNDNTGPLPEYSTSGQSIRIVYSGSTQGWIPLQDSTVSYETPPYTNQGSVSGYTSGGLSTTNILDKFSFVSDGNASDVGDLTQSRYLPAGQSYVASGYTSGGSGGASGLTTIDKFPFAADGNASDVGDLTQGRYSLAGQISTASGYSSGGKLGPGQPYINTIDKFPFSADANASDVGDLSQIRGSVTGQSSTVSGYTSGGENPSNINTIDKFPFASDGNASDVGDLSVARRLVSGQNSVTHGYTSGGDTTTNVIDKFPFAANGNASDVGDLTVARFGPAGQSSTSSGYTSAGYPTYNTIDKFPFASNANASDVGDLTVGRGYATGQQV